MRTAIYLLFIIAVIYVTAQTLNEWHPTTVPLSQVDQAPCNQDGGVATAVDDNGPITLTCVDGLTLTGWHK